MSLFHSHDDDSSYLGYEFEIVDSVNAPGDPKKPNEDSWGINEDGTAAIVVDGVTSKAERSFLELPGMTDPAWCARFLTKIFSEYARYQTLPYMEALKEMREHTLYEFKRLQKAQPREVAEYPMAVLSMARMIGDDLELVNVGDTEIGIITKDGQTFWLHKDPVHRSIEEKREPLKDVLRQQGITDKNALHKAILPFMRRQHNESMNVPGGFGAFSLGRDLLPENVNRLVIPARTVDKIFLATDGLTSYFNPYSFAMYEDLRYAISQSDKPLQSMLRAVRLREEENENANPQSFKKSDDATGLLLRLAV